MNNTKGKWLNNIARLIKKKEKADGTPGGYFLKFERRKDKEGNYIGQECFPLTINEGDILHAQLKSEELKKLVSEGKMQQSTADSISANVKFEFSVAPKDGSKAVNTPQGKQKSSKNSNEVDF